MKTVATMSLPAANRLDRPLERRTLVPTFIGRNFDLNMYSIWHPLLSLDTLASIPHHFRIIWFLSTPQPLLCHLFYSEGCHSYLALGLAMLVCVCESEEGSLIFFLLHIFNLEALKTQ